MDKLDRRSRQKYRQKDRQEKARRMEGKRQIDGQKETEKTEVDGKMDSFIIIVHSCDQNMFYNVTQTCFRDAFPP